MKSFEELNGTIILRNTGVEIIRDSALGTTFHNAGELEIPYESVSHVVVVPGLLLNGYICIVENGYGSPSGVFSAMKDENAVVFDSQKA